MEALGTGPVFVYESLLNARRWQVYAGRSAFVLLLLVGLAVVWLRKDTLTGRPARDQRSTSRWPSWANGSFTRWRAYRYR